jgi:hypothetical protein
VCDLHAPVVLADGRNRCPKPHDPAQPVGQPRGEPLGTALQAALLGAAAGGGEPLERAPRPAVEQEMQERHLGHLGAEHRRDERAPVPEPEPGLGVSGEPCVRRLRVPRGGLGHAPRLTKRDGLRHLLEALLRFADVREGVFGQGEVVPSVALHGAVHSEEVLAFDIGREQADAELPGERQDAVLGRTDPLPAQLDHGAALERVVQEAPADPVTGLQDEDRKTGG